MSSSRIVFFLAFAAFVGAQVIVDDETPLQRLARHSGLSMDHFRRVRQVIAGSPGEIVDQVANQEKIERLILNTEKDLQTASDSRSIVEVNEELLSYLYKGDILLSPEQLKMLEEKQSSRKKRFAPITWVKLWDTPGPIPYRFEDSLPQSGIVAVQNAMEILTNRSCLSFVKNSSSKYGLSFFSGPGCYSYIGQIRGWQQVSIGGGCEATGVAAHEILHALGSDHEQDRTDRNDYVTINNDVIEEGQRGNFELRSAKDNDNLGVPYDFGSIMHYAAYDYSSDENTPSILAKDALYTQTMGQRRYVAFNDFKSLNKLYKCNAACPSPPSCQNGGYIHPKDCAVCVCPDFFKGATCESPVFNYDLPAGTRLSTIYYSQKNDALRTLNSEWSEYDKASPKLITAPEGMRLNVTVTGLQSDFDCFKTCPRVGIELVEGADLTRAGKVFCCAKDVGTSFTTLGRSLGIKAYNTPGTAVNITISFKAV